MVLGFVAKIVTIRVVRCHDITPRGAGKSAAWLAEFPFNKKVRSRLAIVQDYVPQYRCQFFSRLVDRLRDIDIECIVVAGMAPGSSALRGDSVAAADWLRKVADPYEVRPIQTGPRLFGFGTDRHWRDCDGVIMGLRGAAFDLHLELLRKKFTGRRVGVWGHLSRFVKPPNALDLAIERWQMRRSDHVFAYTQQGADVAVANGIRPGNVTAVMNSTDVSDLVSAYAQLDQADNEAFSRQHSLVPGKTFGFIGGLDYSKRVDFLAKVLDDIWGRDREVKLVVAGRGEQEHLLRASARRGQAIMLGYSGPSDKARILRASQALVNPGRIGLVAVESLAVGIPILATDWQFHAPEYDYLTPGRDVFVAKDNVSDFASLVLKQTNNTGNLICKHIGQRYPTIDAMIYNFASGVEAMFTNSR